MNHFPRLVFTASSIVLLVGSTSGWAASSGPGKDGAQLVPVGQDTQAMLLHGSPGYLGVEIRDLDADRAAALKLKDAAGAEIIIVDHDAPSGKAGLRVHDVILQMNGQQVQGVDQLRRMLREIPAGRSVSLLISRDGQQQSVTVQLADRTILEQDSWSQHLTVPEPGDDVPMMGLTGPTGHGFGGSSGFFGSFTISPSYVGVQLDTLGSQLADYFGVKDGQGLLVKRVEENSPASAAGLKAGDVITKVNGQIMATLNDWGKTIHANRGKQIQVTIVRNRKEQIVNMQAGDAKHKGEVVMPEGIDPEMIDPEMKAQIDSMLAQLDTQIDTKIDPGLIDKAFGDVAKNIDTKRLEQELKEQQKQFQEQMEKLRENLKSLECHQMD
jgi:serine protease Do